MCKVNDLTCVGLELFYYYQTFFYTYMTLECTIISIHRVVRAHIFIITTGVRYCNKTLLGCVDETLYFKQMRGWTKGEVNIEQAIQLVAPNTITSQSQYVPSNHLNIGML